MEGSLADIVRRRYAAARSSTGRTAASTWLAVGRDPAGFTSHAVQLSTSPQLSASHMAAGPGVPGGTQLQRCHWT